MTNQLEAAAEGKQPTADGFVSRWLQDATPAVFTTYCIGAAFATYFCMYAFRKPFTAAEYAEASLWGLGYKSVLVAAQVSGYTLSKFLGVKFISETPPGRRAVSILALIASAELALVGFALAPPPYNWPFLFLNGLPLGMVFGLVLSFLEGRRLTEALAAGLCASFIISSGVVKSLGRWLLVEAGVGEYSMPFVAGMVFLAPLALSVWLLSRIPPPTEADIAHRMERAPMDAASRRRFFRRHALGLTALIAVYVALSVLRGLRDDFAVEIWQGLGHSGAPSVFALSEVFVMLGVLLVNGSAAWIVDNRRALLFSLLLVFGGFLIVLLALAGHRTGGMGPFTFMVTIGLGAHIPYVAFHTTVFERLIATFGERANLGYLMYLADASGYLGYVVVMFCKPLLAAGETYLELFVLLSTWITAAALVVTGALLMYYFRSTRPGTLRVQTSADVSS